MRILQHTLAWAWCRTHGAGLDESGSGAPRLADAPELAHRFRVVFAPQGPAGHEPAVASAILGALGRWDECLLWITGWGRWPSREDWPRYYALRGRHGERMSIDDAPGHVVEGGETDDLHDLLVQVLGNGWDAIVIPARDGCALPVRVRISHDGWFRVDAADPHVPVVPGLEAEPV